MSESTGNNRHDSDQDVTADAFLAHDPPPGGLNELRRRIEQDQRAVRWWIWLAPVAVAAAVLLLVAPWRSAPPLIVVRPAPTARPISPKPAALLGNRPGAVGLGLVDPARQRVTTPPSASARQATLLVAETDDVVFYQVATLPDAEPGTQLNEP